MSRIQRIRRASDRAARVASEPAESSLPEAGHLADVLSHRLRGLVSGILGYTDLLLEQLGRKGQRELAMRILESAQRIEHVLADLKHFTRPVTPHLEGLVVSDLVMDLVKRLPDETAERIRLDLDGTSEQTILADRYLSRDILLLLIQNAAEASRAPAALGLRVRVDGRMVDFDVTNDGTIDAEALPRLFEPFFTTKARNLGVGLPLARRLARLQCGDVTNIPSAEPDIVTFRYRIPLTSG